MLIRDRGYRRAVSLGPHPLEALERIERSDLAAKPGLATQQTPSSGDLSAAADEYVGYFAPFAGGEPAERSPAVSDDLDIRTEEIKGAAYYFDAQQVGVCRIDAGWAVVALIQWGQAIEPDNLAADWIAGAEASIARMRGVEIATSIAGHIRAYGYNALAHWAGNTDQDLAYLALLAGLVQHDAVGLRSPFLAERFEIVAITTDYELRTDQPLAPGARVNPAAPLAGYQRRHLKT